LCLVTALRFQSLLQARQYHLIFVLTRSDKRDLWDKGLYDAPSDHRSQSRIVMMSVFSSSGTHRYVCFTGVISCTDVCLVFIPFNLRQQENASINSTGHGRNEKHHMLTRMKEKYGFECEFESIRQA
jgi:hypothetical protein